MMKRETNHPCDLCAPGSWTFGCHAAFRRYLQVWTGAMSTFGVDAVVCYGRVHTLSHTRNINTHATHAPCPSHDLESYLPTHGATGPW